MTAGLLRKARRAPRGRRSELGLTLIELLVSLALLAVLTGFMAGGLSVAIKAFDADRRNSADMEDGSAIATLANFVGSAMPAADAGRASNIRFEGRGSRLDFVALSEGRSLRGGLQDVTVRRIGDELVVEIFGPPAKDGRPKLPTSSVVVLKGVRGVRLRYFGVAGAQGEPAWRDDWLKAERLPSLVSVGLEFEDARQSLPPAVIALRNQGGR